MTDLNQFQYPLMTYLSQTLVRLQIWLSKKLFNRNNLASPLLIHEMMMET